MSTAPGPWDNPHNWGKWTKSFVFTTGLLLVMNSTVGSSLPSNSSTSILSSFPSVTSLQMVLPVSMYLVGFVFGPMLWGPLSEVLGRRTVLLSAFLLYAVFTMACALAPNFPALLVFRLVAGVGAAAAVAVVGGVYADIYPDTRERGWAIAWLMSITNLGPCLGPLISGYVSQISWRWSFWVGLMMAGATLPFALWLPETFAPVLQQRILKKLKGGVILDRENQNPAQGDMEDSQPRMSLSTLARPFHLLIHESIVMLTCLYLSFAYSIFYLYLQAYAVIFLGPSSIYKLSTQLTGLTFLPIGIGAILAGGIFCIWDVHLAAAQKKGKTWTQNDELRRLPLACAGGPLFVSSLFWLGWSCDPSVRWIVPAFSGLLFGIGFVLIFISMLNYLTDAYEIYAASAHSIASTCRSVFGTLLPLAGRKMYVALGVNWASSLLGFAGMVLAAVPFAFIVYGERIRAGSKFSRQIRERKIQGVVEV
ncbi:MFS general substrate transporter [Cadophora sp. DSE1049]|nr:MFS general substrate transporter [Cadophora sp. DSE1049]